MSLSSRYGHTCLLDLRICRLENSDKFIKQCYATTNIRYMVDFHSCPFSFDHPTYLLFPWPHISSSPSSLLPQLLTSWKHKLLDLPPNPRIPVWISRQTANFGQNIKICKYFAKNKIYRVRIVVLTTSSWFPCFPQSPQFPIPVLAVIAAHIIMSIRGREYMRGGGWNNRKPKM